MNHDDLLLCKRYLQAKAIEEWVKPEKSLDFENHPSEKLRREIVHRYREGMENGDPGIDEIISVLMRGQLRGINVRAPQILVDWLNSQRDVLDGFEFKKLFYRVLQAGIDPRVVDDAPPPTIEFRHKPPLPPVIFDQPEEVPTESTTPQGVEIEPATPIEREQPQPDGRGGELDLVPEGVIYVIRHITSGMIKVGVTSNWPRRAEELRVGVSTEMVQLVWSEDKISHEQRVHAEFDLQRLPQSEWFHLTDNRLQEALDSVRKAGQVITQRQAEERAR